MNIKLDYTLDADDYYDFHRANLKHRRVLTPPGLRGWRSPRWIFWGAVITGVIGFSVLDNWLWPLPAAAPAATRSGPAALFMPLVLLALCAFFIWARRSRFLYRRLAAANMKIGQRVSAELVDEHVTCRGPDFVAVMDWSYFLRCIETKSAFCLFTVPRNAHILPKRAFVGVADIEEFRRFAQARVGCRVAGPIPPVVQKAGN